MNTDTFLVINSVIVEKKKKNQNLSHNESSFLIYVSLLLI